MNRLPFVIAAIAVVAGIIYSAVFVVTAREQAIVLRFGEIARVIEQPGIYFKVPTNIMDTVQYVDKRVLKFDLENLRVQVRDGRRYLVDAFIAFQIIDARKFRENVAGNLTLAEANMRTRLDAALRRVYGQRSFEAALSEQRIEMMREVRDQIRPNAREIGIDIVDVRITRTDLLPEVSQQTFERMRAERLAEAAQLRARGTEDALRIRAEADREAVVTVAEARREAEIMRGEGDAERNNVFAEAYRKDPEFFNFYRSLSAYEAATIGSDTTMVLQPNTDFFRYFNSPGVISGGIGGGTGPQAAGAPFVAPAGSAGSQTPAPDVQPGQQAPTTTQ